ncbi:MAG: PQQ-binding-like beta-propeller repeat protein [Anaerolineae bacterium]|nr:PQQ-binding-like beta-propeller repeat protein [Anaerolineae bacterium]
MKKITHLTVVSVALLLLSACTPGPQPAVVWKFNTEGPIWNTPIIAQHSVYIGNHHGLYGVNRNTGEKLWEVQCGEQVYISPHSMADDLLYFGVRGDHYLYAAKAQTGEVTKHIDLEDKQVILPPITANAVVYYATNDGMLHAWDSQSQTVMWSTDVSASLDSSISVADDTVYVAGNWQGELLALDTQTGAQRWRMKTNHQGASKAIVVDGILYFGSSDGHLYAVKAQTGEEQWRFRTNGPVDGISYTEGTIYIGSEDHHVYAIDSATGKQKWKFKAKDKIVTSPLSGKGAVYFGSLDGHLYAVDAGTGRQIWAFLTGGPINSSPVEADGLIYFGSDDGYLYAVAPPS